MKVVLRRLFLRRLRTVCLAASLILPVMLSAEEGGLVTLTLTNEQLDMSLSAGHSDWTGSRGFAEVSILSRPTDVETWERFQSLRLTFDLLRSGAQSPEMSLLRRTDDAVFQRWYGRSDNGGLSVRITDRSLVDDLLQVSGTFAGTLGQSTNFGQTIDFATPMPVSGTFAVTLLPIR